VRCIPDLNSPVDIQGGFARCYVLTSLETNRNYCGKIVAKDSLVKQKAKDKVAVSPFYVIASTAILTYILSYSFKPRLRSTKRSRTVTLSSLSTFLRMQRTCTLSWSFAPTRYAARSIYYRSCATCRLNES
jgi:hypothetical protein